MIKFYTNIIIRWLAAGKESRDGFRGLWRRVKPVDKPDEVRFRLLINRVKRGCSIILALQGHAF